MTATTVAPPRPFHRWKSNETTDTVPFETDRCRTCRARRTDAAAADACPGTDGDTEAWWILINRQYSADLLVGPYDDQPAAEHAMNNAPLIDGFCEDDCLDCTAVGINGIDPAWEVVRIDPDDPDHTGAAAELGDDEPQPGDLVDDVRPYSRARALAMLALYTGRPVQNVESVNTESLQNLVTDLIHLSRAVEALPKNDGLNVYRAAEFIANDEDRETHGTWDTLPDATLAAVPTEPADAERDLWCAECGTRAGLFVLASETEVCTACHAALTADDGPKLTRTQREALALLNERGYVYVTNRRDLGTNGRTFSRRTLAALVDAGLADPIPYEAGDVTIGGVKGVRRKG